MVDIPFSWNIDLEISRIRTLYGSGDDPVLPYEPPSTVIKVSKFQLGSIYDTAWTLQFEHAKIYDRSFYGQEEKSALLLEREAGIGKVETKGLIELYDLSSHKRLSKSEFEYVLDDRQKVVNLSLDITMSELSYAVFENTQLCIQGNISFKSLSDSYAQEDSNFDLIGKTNFLETHIIKNNPLVELSYDLKSLLKEGSFSDLTIVCDDCVFKAHKNILSARSPVFAAMFQAPMSEQKSNSWDIVDLQQHIVKKMLKFVYSGQVKNLDFDMACALLFAADKYQLHGLIAICVEYLKSELSAENAIRLLIEGNWYDAGLKNFAMEYISKNYIYFQSTEEWKALKKDNMTLAMEVLEHTVTTLNDKKHVQYNNEE